MKGCFISQVSTCHLYCVPSVGKILRARLPCLTTGFNFAETNAKQLESAHSSLRISEERHGLKICRKIGTPLHAVKSEMSLTFYNSKRAKMSPSLCKRRSPITNISQGYNMSKYLKEKHSFLNTIVE